MTQKRLTAKQKKAIESVRSKPSRLSLYKKENQFEELIFTAIKRDHNCYSFIRKDLLTDFFIDKLVKLNGEVVYHLNASQQTYERWLMAVESKPNTLGDAPYIFMIDELMSDELIKTALSKQGSAIKYLYECELKEEYCWIALKQDASSIKEIKNPTEEMCKFALKQNGNLIQYIKNPTSELCMIALEQSPDAIEFINL